MEAKDWSAVRVGPGEGRAVRLPGVRLATRKVSCEWTGGAYSLFEVEVGVGGGERPHIQHREDECFYVVEGEFEFLVEGDAFEAGPGSLVYVPKGNLHAFENVGMKTGRLLMSQTPGGSYERFLKAVEKAGNLANDGVPPRRRDRRTAKESPRSRRSTHGIEMVPLSAGRASGRDR